MISATLSAVEGSVYRGNTLFPALALAVTLTLPTPGKPQTAPQSTAPILHVYSRETIIDVLVTDDKGQPVRGLIRSDFTVEEDSKPQPIRSFREYSKEVSHTSPRVLPPNTWSNAPVMANGGPIQIFLFDRVASAPEDLVRSKKYIAKYFRTMPAGTTVAIFVLSLSKGLRLLQGFTSDGALAASAVENIDVEWGLAPDVHVPFGQLPVGIAAANQIAAYAADMQGRKNLIWILTGSPPAIVHDGGLSWGNTDMTAVHRLMNLYDLFTKEQIAIYPLDPKGVHTLGPLAGKMDSLAQARAFLTRAENPLLEEAIADGTGGATSNSNDYQGTIAKIVDDTEHSYILSYVPSRPDVDGHFHPIHIQVDRPDVHLTYRTGYNDERSFPLDPVLKQAMIQGPMRLGALPATQLIFDVQVTPTQPNPNQSGTRRALSIAGKSPVTYNVLYQLDPSQIDFAASADGLRNACLEFDVAAYDSYGKRLNIRGQTLKLPLTPEEYQDVIQKPVQFSLTIDLPPGQLTLRVGLFDTVANKAGTLEIPLTIPKK
jgi:VWFA-related protein